MEQHEETSGRTVEELERELREVTVALADARRELAESRRLAKLGQVAVGIGHELRQPLATINNLAYCVRLATTTKSHEPDARERAEDYLARLTAEVVLADRIISNLMEYARTQHAKRFPTDLNLLLQQECSVLHLPESIRFQSELAPALPQVLVDAFQISRSFQNLASNAVESMAASGGELGVRTYEEAGRAVLEIRDTGGGISEEIRDKVFEPLFSARTSGLGLGLALTRLLIEANGGSISFSSQIGAGTRFLVSLPFA